jgi:hypothetical protein
MLRLRCHFLCYHPIHIFEGWLPLWHREKLVQCHPLADDIGTDVVWCDRHDGLQAPRST